MFSLKEQPGAEYGDAHAFSPGNSGGRWISVSSRPAWSTYQVPDQPGLYSETLLQNNIHIHETDKNKEFGRIKCQDVRERSVHKSLSYKHVDLSLVPELI